jgi:carbamoyl-phosphate synthase large subunit
LRADEFLSWLQGNENRMPEAHLVEYLEGEEYSVDTLSIEGKVLKAVVRRRLSSIYGIATEAVVENDPKAEQAACEICESLRLDYVSNIQFRKDGNGDLKIMEINPRIPGTIGLTVNAGVNMPYLALKLLLREEVNIPPVEYGKRILRFWDGIYI